MNWIVAGVFRKKLCQRWHGWIGCEAGTGDMKSCHISRWCLENQAVYSNCIQENSVSDIYNKTVLKYYNSSIEEKIDSSKHYTELSKCSQVNIFFQNNDLSSKFAACVIFSLGFWKVMTLIDDGAG